MRVPCLASLLFLAAFSCAQTLPSRAQTNDPEFRKQVEKEAFLLVNQYRKENDFPPLAWDDAIANTARAHSKDMASGDSDFGHDGFSERIAHLKETKPGIGGAGENVLYSSDLNDIATRAVQMWLHSPHHLKNIRGDYNYSGLGVWQDKDGTMYFTQIFLKIKPPAQETQAASPSSDAAFMGLLGNPDSRSAR